MTPGNVGGMPQVPELSRAVREALDAGRPVVALESTIISHGLPRPGNLGAARSFEALLADSGVTPATIAVIDGVPKAGLSDAELERIALDPSVIKVSSRDLGLAMAAQADRGHHGRGHVGARGRAPGSGSSPPAASAACTAASPRHRTSRPTSPCCPAPRSPWSARA